MMASPQKPEKIKQIVVSQVAIPANKVSGFLARMCDIKQSSPSLFAEIIPIAVSESELYRDRVKRSLNGVAVVEEDGAESADKPHPHEKLNRVLMVRLEKQMKVAQRRGRAKKRAKVLKVEKKLPILEHRQEILDTIANNQVVLIRGATGCGKTTQVPQFILDSYIKEGRGTDCRVVCTQPRRVAAISIASRVAEERKEKLGGESVGFLIRCENEMPRPQGGHILYCTVGVLLRQLQSNPTFRNLTHIIVDEIHERSSESDILLAALKILLPMRPDLRVIVMSATIEMDQFAQYFDNCPTLQIDGFNHEVQEVYLDEIKRLINMPLNKKDLNDRKTKFHFITQLIVNVHQVQPPGAILVFCSGYDEIEILYKSLKRTEDKSMKVHILHSLVPVRKDKIFLKPREGERKIILSTNVAESSITIKDVVYVIDNGRVKVMSFSAKTKIHSLQNSWITKANAMQRKGRAGRCQAGTVYRLYDRSEYEQMEEYVRANVTRERLESVILDVMVWNFGPVKEFFQSLLSPPQVESIDHSVNELQNINAVTRDGRLTVLGRRLSSMHLDPQLGQMMIYATIFNCVDPITSVTAYLSFKDLFMLPLGNKKARREIKTAIQTANGQDADKQLSGMMEVQLQLDDNMQSDHFTRIKAVEEYRKNSIEDKEIFCYEHYLNESTMIQVMAMRSQIINSLARNKFIAKAQAKDLTNASRSTEDYAHVIQAVITAGLYPNTVGIIPTTKIDTKGNETIAPVMYMPTGREVLFHKGSVNCQKKFETGQFVYYKAVSTEKVYLHDSTLVNGLAICLFATDVVLMGNFILVDHFFHFECSLQTQTLIVNLRTAMKNIFNKTVNRPQYHQYKKAENEALQLIADVLGSVE